MIQTDKQQNQSDQRSHARASIDPRCRPPQVIVIGSYARGDADEGSDLDLLVIEREVADKAAEYLKLHHAIGSIGVGVDVLVFSQEEFERRSQVPGTLPYWAKKEGKLVYDAAA
jgi:predicted nucleotidyltransferase